MKDRVEHVRQMPCIACTLRGREQNTVTEAHHLNIGGKHGQKRRGDRYTIPLCKWHHQGHVRFGWSKHQMAMKYGPSYALRSRAFREEFGPDDFLLAETDKRYEALYG